MEALKEVIDPEIGVSLVEMNLIYKSDSERIKELSMLRKNFGQLGGDQKFFLYFFSACGC